MLGLGPLNHLCFGLWDRLCFGVSCCVRGRRLAVPHKSRLQWSCFWFVFLILHLIIFVSSPDERRSPFPAPLAPRTKPLLLQAADGPSQIPLFIPHLPGHTTPRCSAVPHWCALNPLHSLGGSFPCGQCQSQPGGSSRAAAPPCTGFLYKSLAHYTESWASPVKSVHITLAPKWTRIALQQWDIIFAKEKIFPSALEGNCCIQVI